MTEGASVASRYHSYEDFWGRRCAQVFKQTDAETPSVDIYRFAPTWKVWAPAFGVHVYMTEGMASREMPPRAANDPRELRRVELCAYTRKVRESAPGMDAAGRLAVSAVVDQIIGAESGGDAGAKNKLSSATGAGPYFYRLQVEP